MAWALDETVWRDKYGKTPLPPLLPDPDNHSNTTASFLGHHTVILTTKALVIFLKANYLLPLHSNTNDKHEILHKYCMIRFMVHFGQHCLLQLEGSVTYYQHCLQEREENTFLDPKERAVIALWKNDDVKKRLGMSLQHLECLFEKHFEEEGPAKNFNSAQLSFHLNLLRSTLIPIARATVHCVTFSNIRKRLHSCLHQSQDQLRIWWNIDEELIRYPLSLKTFFHVTP